MKINLLSIIINAGLTITFLFAGLAMVYVQRTPYESLNYQSWEIKSFANNAEKAGNYYISINCYEHNSFRFEPLNDQFCLLY